MNKNKATQKCNNNLEAWEPGLYLNPSKISSCSSGIAFWVTQVGWQFLSTLILGGDICFWAKNYLEKVLEYHFWGRTFHFSIPTDTGLMIIKLAFCEEHSILIVISTECLIYFVTPVFTLLSRLKSKSNVLNPNIWTLVDNKVTKSSNSTLSPNKL